MARKGLGKGLDSLIPDIYNENFDSNSPKSLEDILNEESPTDNDDEKSQGKKIEKESQEDETSVNNEEDVPEVVDDSGSDVEDEVPEVVDDSSSGIENESIEEPAIKKQFNLEHVEEVKKIVEKNPRITLWSSRSSAVLRYLRKTEPEFSISKEASKLIEEAVYKKYPEIWELFDEEND